MKKMGIIACIGILVCALFGCKLAADSNTWDDKTETPAFMSMVKVPGGSFTVGSVAIDSEKETQVLSFLLGTYEVTQGQWEDVMGTDWPGRNETDRESKHSDTSSQPNETYGRSPLHPAYYINWYDAIEFCNALSKRENLYEAYKIDKKDSTKQNEWEIDFVTGANGYRLPTLVEWEYAAGHGGFFDDGTPKDRTLYSGTNNIDDLGKYAWYFDNNGESAGDADFGTKVIGTAGNFGGSVGSGKPNALGLYDMSGNVWEWCNDRIVQSSSGFSLLLRGGYWESNPADEYIGFTYSLEVTHMQRAVNNTYRYDDVGFRVARSVNE